VNIDLGDHMLLLSTSKIERRLMKFPLVKRVRIYRHIPSRIVISVTERQPYAYVFFGDRYYLVDDEAVLLEEGVEVPKKLDAVLINVTSFRNNGLGKMVAFPYVARFDKVCDAVRKSLGGRGWKISMTTDGIKVYLKSGFFILLGDGDGVGRKMAIVPLLLGSMNKSGERFQGLNLRFLESPSFIRKSANVGSGSGT
jgi:cell division septal protein FtsQ